MTITDKELIRKTVHETLFQIGIEAEDNDDVKEFRRDVEFLRDLRTSVNTVKTKGLLAAIGIVTAGFLALLWLGIKSVFGGN